MSIEKFGFSERDQLEISARAALGAAWDLARGVDETEFTAEQLQLVRSGIDNTVAVMMEQLDTPTAEAKVIRLEEVILDIRNEEGE